MPVDNLENLNWGLDSDFCYISGNTILFFMMSMYLLYNKSE